MRRRILISAGLVTLVALLSLTPPPPDPSGRMAWMSVWVPLVDGLGFPYNLDSARFVALGEHPGQLLEPRNGRQSRPLYIVTGHLLARGLTRVLPAKSAALASSPTYVAFIAINLVVLVAAVALYDALFTEHRWAFAVLATSVLLVANNVVRDHVWAPHTEMFTVLMPVLSMFLCRWMAAHSSLSWRRVGALGFLAGVLLLYYASFVLLLPSVACGLIMGRVRSAAPRTVEPLSAQLAALVLGFTVAPAAWWLTVTIVAGEFYSDETTRYRQFVWLIDAWNDGSILVSLRQRLGEFARVAAGVTWFPLMACAAAGVAALLTGVRRKQLVTHESVVAAAGVTLALTLVFFGLMGWYNERLEWNVVPPILVITTVLLAAARERASRFVRVLLAIAVATVSVGWLGYEVCTKRGSSAPAVDGVRSPACPSGRSLLDRLS